jgi:S-adenosylmethionine synthetase
VTEGHPDKIADQISDAVVDAALAGDPLSRVACETLLTTGLIVVAGEITSASTIDYASLAREVVNGIGYDNGECFFDGSAVGVMVAIDKQSPDIAQGVDTAHEGRVGGSEDPLDRIGAGDQGMMFGYASNETPEYMPAPVTFAHQLSKKLAEVRHSGVLPYLRPDGKTQVTVRYDESGKPAAIEKVLISTQHQDGVESKLPDALWDEVVLQVLPPDLYDPARLREEFYVNPTGRFVIGGPVGDTGLTGRAEVQVAYAIGVARPLSLLVETFGTEKIARAAITGLVRENFDLRPGAILRDLDLRRPIYRPTAAYGHFGRSEDTFTWERTDKAPALAAQAGL